MSAPTVRHPEVRVFVDAVRAALDDLTPDEVEELTGGLEADLDDALNERKNLDAQGDPSTVLGDPRAYADELRAAAGLPARAAAGGRSTRVGAVAELTLTLRRRGSDARRRLESQRWWPLAREYGASLRPAWWVLRAWIAYQVLHQVLSGGTGGVLPQSLRSWVLALVVLLASLELGRRARLVEASGLRETRSRRARWGMYALVAGNVIAVLAHPAALNHGLEQASSGWSAYPMPPNGLWLNGVEVRNVFPYDAQGNPLTGVQLFDENGNQLTVGESARGPLSDDQGNLVAQVPAVGHDSSQRWNVFPLRQQVISLHPDLAPGADQTMPYAAPWPMPTAGPLLAPSVSPTSRPSPQATRAPTVGASAVP